ncbi:MAG TPA: efflux RND transporter periplasmic adaptor subunit, partial [Gemmatimonadales bacterium]|nr:efflux RND transporter periplasmic adaptor subunit [Gemmatimonadales bacterium]
MTRVHWYRAVLPVLTVALFCCKPKPSDSAAAAADPVVLVGRENIAVADSAQLRSGPAISGSLEPKVEARVRAEIMGPVEKTFVDEGQRVKPGVLLARINDNSVRDAYLSARSAVRTAESALQNARRNAERSSRLAQAGALSDRDLETAQQAHTNAEGALADAQARLASAQKQVGNTEVRAPISGIVSERQVAAGDVVQVGGAMFTIVDLRTLRLEATVPVEEIGRLKVGTPVEFGVSGFDRRFTGKIERIN